MSLSTVSCMLIIPPTFGGLRYVLFKLYFLVYIWFVLIFFVVLGKIYMLGSTIHHQTIKDDMVRVVVVDVRDSTAPVPVPTEEVQIVGQAPGNFIIWPTRLAKPIVGRVGFRTCFNYVFILCNILT